MRLIPEDRVRDMLTRGYNRPDDEADSAVASLTSDLGELEHPTADDRLTAAFASLDRAHTLSRVALALDDAPDDEEETVLECAVEAVVELARAVVYAIAYAGGQAGRH